MNRILTLLAGVLIYTMSVAQDKPSAVFTLADVSPVIDGVVDEVWAEATEYKLDKKFNAEEPSIGNTTFKCIWSSEGLFVLVVVDDDGFLPHYNVDPVVDQWMADKVELYFDVNFVLDDGIGGGGGNGHYQFAPAFTDGKNDGTRIDESNFSYAYKVTDPAYVAEFYVPFSTLLDKDGVAMPLTAEFGFDITVIDIDAADYTAGVRKRMVWANDATVTGESYSSMDACGLATLEGVDDQIYIDEMEIEGPTEITTDGGTAQLTVKITPEDATIQTMAWSAEPADLVSVDNTGLVTAIKDGTVTITATATDGSYLDDTYEITITNQVLTIGKINLLKNWTFDTNTDGWGGWIDGESAGEPAVVEDGVAVMKTKVRDANYFYQFSQEGFKAVPNEPYVLRFKAWASGDRPTTVDFEDNEGNGYNRYGATTDPRSADGRSEWTFNATTEPTWFEFDVVFDAITETTTQKVQFLLSTSEEVFYLDSILVLKVADLENLPTAAKDIKTSFISVYPNPVAEANQIFVEVENVNTTIAIYNAVGQKVMEQVSKGTVATFNVADLNKGIYVVRLSDGTSQKFIR